MEQIDASRRRAAVETYARHQTSLRRTARRYSLCDDDAEDALQRGLEILLRKAPSEDPRELIRWTQTVVKHEALAVRRERERILAGPAAGRAAADGEDWVALIPAPGDGPAERVERREAVARSREALQALKPQELRALTLLAEGYSYREIGEITGFSATKVNRCLAEGRERFRGFLAHSGEGARCSELRALLSAFCDGETSAEEAASLREHLRACAHCRATLRAYRAAPGAAGALAPTLPLGRPLVDRAQEALSGLVARFGGGPSTDSALTQVAAAGGTRGAGTAVLAKVLTVCVGTVGGAAACVASGVVPTPLVVADNETQPARLEQPAKVPEPQPEEESAEVGYDPAPTPAPPGEEAASQPEEEPAPPATSSPPSTSGGAVEYAPPPQAPPTPATASPSAPAAAAGEFGP